MEIQRIDETLLSVLYQRANESERKRMNFDLRTSEHDTSQRMLNALEPETKVPIHRHLETSETVVCLEGCLDEIFYQELPNMDVDDLIHDVETSVHKSNFVEVMRVRLCPREKKFGVQIPKGLWHTVEIIEPSIIFEAKDGTYKIIKGNTY